MIPVKIAFLKLGDWLYYFGVEDWRFWSLDSLRATLTLLR